jgi:RND family efflux transporter MFP subunit
MSAKQKVIKILLPLVILAVGIIVMRVLILSRSVPQKTETINPGALVEVVSAAKQDKQLQIYGTGTVQPEQEVSVTMQVDGLIDKVAPGFVAGGFFGKGDLLFAVESVDYELAVDRARTALIKAENEITIIESKAIVARQEWERLKLGDTEEPNPLIVYKPQLEDAKANRTAAIAALKQAELNLQRTRVVAPFNCLVRSEEVGLGKYVRSGNNVAMIASVDAAEIVVPLPLDDLQWINTPGQGSGKKGSQATVSLKVGDKDYKWQGKVVRSLGEVDPRSRMARLVVQVDDPYGLHDRNTENRMNLELGMFVEVLFAGEVLTGVIEIPRTSLRENSSVWVMDNDQKLRVKHVGIARLEKQSALINEGLQEGDMVILTALPGGIDGMKLRPANKGESR